MLIFIIVMWYYMWIFVFHKNILKDLMELKTDHEDSGITPRDFGSKTWNL